ncbi:MAG TPA: response regulator [Euryarchaeota archaeon]|nr:response regulator [Euryarchaeota archaeon]
MLDEEIVEGTAAENGAGEERIVTPEEPGETTVAETIEAEETGEEEEAERPKRFIVIVDSMERELDEAISAIRKGEYRVVGVESAEEFFEVTRGRDEKRSEELNKKAITPDEYWTLARGNTPDLVITALDLKDLEGWEFIMRLKFDNRFYEYQNVQVMVRTDEPVTVETVKKVQAESIVDYFPKSVGGADLLAKVDKYFVMREKLSARKSKIAEAISHVVGSEYERISLAIRIRLKYTAALKAEAEKLKEAGAAAAEIKNLEDIVYLETSNIINYERRRREIKKLLKKKQVKDDDGGSTAAKVESD